MNIKVIGGVAVAVIAAIFLVALIDSAMSDDPSDPEPGPAYTVTYHGNGGVTSSGADTYTSHESKVVDNMFTRGYYVFDTWNTKADGSGLKWGPGNEAFSEGDLYAMWKVPITANSITLPDDFSVWTIVGNELDHYLETGMSKSCTAVPNIGIFTSNYGDDTTITITETDLANLKATFKIENSGGSDGVYTATITISGATVTAAKVSSAGACGIEFDLSDCTDHIYVSVNVTENVTE